MASPALSSPDSFVEVPDFGPLADSFRLRIWPGLVINEFIVGCLHAERTYDQIISYFQWVYKDLLEITSHEVETMWLSVIPGSPHMEYWRAKPKDSAEVKYVLGAMKREWNMWRDLGAEGVMKELGEE